MKSKILSTKTKQNEIVGQGVSLPPFPWRKQGAQKANYIISPLLTKETGKEKIKQNDVYYMGKLLLTIYIYIVLFIRNTFPHVSNFFGLNLLLMP